MVLPRFTQWLPFVLVSAACSANDSGQPPNPVAPGRTIEGTGTNLTFVIVPRGGYTIRGLTSERTSSGGTRPLAGVSVNAWVDTGRFGYSYTWWAMGPTLSDGGGHYELAGLPESARVNVDVWKEGYVQQCAAPPKVMNSDFTVDAELVPRALVSVSPETVTNQPGFRSISGTVYESTADGRRPATGVFVSYEYAMDSTGAMTVSDAAGRYLLCGIPDDEVATVVTSLNNGRIVYVEVPPGQTTVDLVIP